MKLRIIALTLIVISVCSFLISEACNCSHCENPVKVIGIEEDEEDQPTENLIDKEDLDGDGSRTICARDRDHEDQTFPSICHMKCSNRCEDFGVYVQKDDNGTEFRRAMIYRTNFYKLHDGACPRKKKIE